MTRRFKHAVPVWSVDRTDLLFLGHAFARGLVESATNGRAQVRHETANWNRIDGSRWECRTEHIAFSVVKTEEPERALSAFSTMHFRVTAQESLRIGRCSVEILAPCLESPWYLDRFLRWRRLRGVDTLNDYGHFLVRWKTNGGTVKLQAPRDLISSRIAFKNGVISLVLDIEAAALHPRWQFSDNGMVSTAAPLWQKGTSVSFDLEVFLTDATTELPPVSPSRFPHGAEAAFVVTDHCDYEDTDRLNVFLHGDGINKGWLNRGLRMTKGVFMLASTPLGRKPVPSLQEPPYKALIRELQADGSEIAPHALNESGNLSPEVYRAALKAFVAEWSPITWVDHGATLEYCYTMGAADHPEYRLLDDLKELGFKTMWSYHDVPMTGTSSLNLLSPSRQPALALAQALRHFLRLEFLIGLHYIRSSTLMLFRRYEYGISRFLSAVRSAAMKKLHGEKITKEELLELLPLMLKAGRSRETASVELYSQGELVEMASVVYPERAAPIHEVNDSELLLFVTMEAVHTRDTYTSKALARLVEERGLHIGHCYLLNTLPYIAGIFARSDGRVVLSPSWCQFLDSLESSVRNGVIWNPPAGEMVEWIRAMQRMKVTRLRKFEVQVENPMARVVTDYTLLFPKSTSVESIRWAGQKPKGHREWPDWFAIWGDVPARSAIRVRWAITDDDALRGENA